jgi:hypothetical protein
MRSHPFTPGLALLVLGSLAACSETPPPAVPVVTPTATTAVAAPPAVPEDLAPVAEPSDIVILARWKNPNATISGLTACAAVPTNLAENNARKLVDRALVRAFRGGVDGRQIADLVSFDASVDLVASLEPGRRGTPRMLSAFSIGLTSLERAKQAMASSGALVELTPGQWRVGVKDSGDLTCVIGPAAGAAPARIICGPQDRDVMTLGPYLARNVPVSAPPAHDGHAELRFGAVEARYGGDLRRGLGFLPSFARTQTIGQARFDHALEEAAAALADEGAALINDLDRVTVDLDVDASSCLTAKTSLQLRGKSSWLARSMERSGERAAPPPPLFWRAPIDSESASYSRALDASRYAGIFRVLRDLVEGKLAEGQIGSEADRRALGALIALPFGKDTSMVMASGHAPGTTKQLAAGAKPTAQQIADEVMQNAVGWTMIGFDEGPEALSKLLKDAVDVYARKGLLAPVRKEMGNDADALPAAKIAGATKDLGKGALDLQLKFDVDKSPGAAEKVSFTVHVMLMPDGKTTWLALGLNRDDLVKHLKMAKTGAPDSSTLAARPGLEPLRDGKATGQGFFTLGVLTRAAGNILQSPILMDNVRRPPPGLGELGKALGNLPHRGETPIFLTTQATTSTGPQTDFVVHVQKGTFEDIGVLLMTSLRTGLLPGAQP